VRSSSLGTPALAEIVASFGAELLDAEGRLDRKALAARIFGDDEARRKLEAIVHPRVAERTRERFAELEAQGETLAFYDVPLLVEKGLHEVFRPVVVVALPEEEQVRRAIARDGATEAEVRARIAAQLPLADKIAVVRSRHRQRRHDRSHARAGRRTRRRAARVAPVRRRPDRP
jgi:dephospho-CoA kinase